MDRKVATAISICCIVVGIVLVCFLQAVSATGMPGFELRAENQHLSLFFHPETTEIAVYDRLTGETWYSNPKDRDQLEILARGSAKDAIGAQLRISYFTPGDVRRTMNNYSDSIVYGQFQIEELPNGVRVDYVLGKQWEDDDYFPVVLDVETYENTILPSLNRRELSLLRENYVQVSLVHVGEAGDVGSFMITSPTENLRSRDQVTFAQVLSEHISAQSRSVSHRRDVGDQHLEKFAGETFYMLRARKGDLLAWDREDLIALFRDLEFTPFDVGAMYEEFGLDPLVPNPLTFTIPIEYRLEDDNLVVHIPSEDIIYPQNIISPNNQRVTYPLAAVDVLPYFGAAHSSETGYMFVPNGSGALIYLNNGKMDASAFGGAIYGNDYGLAAPPASLVRSQQNYLPVFGMKKGNQAFFAIIEEGDPIAQVNADISGRQISYNIVYPQFRTMAQTTAQLQGEMPETVHGQASQWVNTSQRMINVYQQELFPGDLTVRYSFLDGDDADYVGMAKYYQGYLVKQGLLAQKRVGENIPLFIELVGAIDDIRPVLGIPLSTVEPLTTFAQAREVVGSLLEQGVTQINLTYSGWLANGVNHTVPSKLRLESSLGTGDEFAELNRFFQEHAVGFYPSVDFLLIHEGTFREFRGRLDASRFLNRAQAQVERQYVFSPMIFETIYNPSWVLSPRRLPILLGGFVQDYDQYGIGQIALNDLGYLLNSDFRLGQEIYRHEAKDIVVRQLEHLTQAQNIELQISGGNAYAIPFADSILNLPLDSERQDLIDEDVPFFPIVIRGFVDYAGVPINFSADVDLAILKTIETGACPYFLGFSRDGSFLKHTSFNYLYTGQTGFWFEDAIGLYHELNTTLKDFRGQVIVDHTKLSDNVYQTFYPTGSVIVNYNPYPVVIGSVRIEPRGYLVVRGED